MCQSLRVRWACESDYAVYDDPEGPECTSLKAKAARCQNLVAGCYKSGSRFACVPANLYCFSGVFGGLQELGLNMYDVRKKCDKAEDKDGPLCYKEMGWMESYMNKPEVKKQLGAPADITFQSCNMQINQAFLLQGDGMHNAGALLPELVNNGIRLLLYAGEADMRKSHNTVLRSSLTTSRQLHRCRVRYGSLTYRLHCRLQQSQDHQLHRFRGRLRRLVQGDCR